MEVYGEIGNHWKSGEGQFWKGYYWDGGIIYKHRLHRYKNGSFRVRFGPQFGAVERKFFMFRIMELLQNEEPIPEENRPHPLTGNYAGHMECHIEGDFLLIWFDPDTDEINLVRLGSHSELFG